MGFSKLFLLYSYEDIDDLNHPYIIPLKLNQTVYFESEAFRMLNEANLPECDNIGFISPKILRNNMKVNNLSLDDYIDTLQNTYDTITPLYTWFGWETHTLNDAVRQHGKNFQKIWDDLSYKIKITNFWYKDVKIFYKNAWIAKKEIVINYLKFIKPIFGLMEEPPIKNLAFTNADYDFTNKMTKEECIQKFGVPFYTLHPFIFRRLICFYKFSIERNKLYTNVFYNKYNKNIYSQNGEDGIIEELLNRLEINKGWVCEFGAWDGIHLSNTFRLVEKGFNAVFIEGDQEKYKDLLKTVESYPNISPINAYVDHNNSDTSLDQLLRNTNIPIDFDILSIDIDSYDYQVWKSLDIYKPKIVIIEINSSIDTNTIMHIHTPGKYAGTGFRPMYNLGIQKGYTFILHTGNMFFIRNDLFNKINITYMNPLENFRTKWTNI